MEHRDPNWPEDNPASSTSDYRLTRLEREVADLRARVESGQGAMLQAVSAIQAQLAQFQVTLAKDLANSFLTRPDADELRREVRERAAANKDRLDRFDAIYVRALEDARVLAEQKRTEDAERSLRINLALIGSALSLLSLLAGVVLHFAPSFHA